MSPAPAPATAPAAGGDLPLEIRLGAGQLLMGTATAALALSLPVFMDGTPLQTVAYAFLSAGPAAVGGVVCTLEQTSKNYRGDCLPVVAGAYLGALAAIPLAFLGGAADGTHFDNGDEGKTYTAGSAIGFAVGYAVGSALGATVAWHRSKEERGVWSQLDVRAAAVAGSVDDHRWPELRWRPVPGARTAIGVCAPLFALAF